MRFAWREHGLTVEPGGSVALAALLAGKVDWVEGTVAVVSGGNVDPELHARIVDKIRLRGCGIDPVPDAPATSARRIGSIPRARGRGCGARRQAPWGRFRQARGGVEQGVEHHGDARQDRLLDPLERFFEPRLLFLNVHKHHFGAIWVKY